MKNRYLCMNTVDGVADILGGGDNYGEGEQDQAGDAPVQAEHCRSRAQNDNTKKNRKIVLVQGCHMAAQFYTVFKWQLPLNNS